MTMKKRLPEAVRQLDAVPKLVWLYIDRYPGPHSVRSLEDALGVHPGRALPALVDAGLLIQEERSVGTRPGKYRTADLTDDAAQAQPHLESDLTRTPHRANMKFLFILSTPFCVF